MNQKNKRQVLALLIGVDLILAIIASGTLLGDRIYEDTSFKEPVLSNPYAILKKCRTNTGQEVIDCTARELTKLAEKHDFFSMSKVLLAIQEAEPSLRNCHVLGHRVAQLMVQKRPGEWKKILSESDPGVCGGGFMHGVLEIRILNDPKYEVNTKVYDEICKGIYVGGYATSCAHILGHIILVENGGELERSLEVCKGLTGDFLFECYGGIFMEDSFKTNFSFHGLGPEPTRNRQWFEAQYRRCQKYSKVETMEAGCFYDLAEVAAQNYDYEAPKTYETCKEASFEESRNRCYARASYIIASAPIPKIDKMNFADLCGYHPFSAKIEQKCMGDTIGALMSYSVSFIRRASLFCDTRKEERAKSACFRILGNDVHRRISSKEERDKFCAEIPRDYRDYCTKEPTFPRNIDSGTFPPEFYRTP